MGFYHQSDMLFQDYRFNDRNANYRQSTNTISRNFFDRLDGDDVLEIINLFGEKYKLKSTEAGTKLEKMIRYKLPRYVQTQNNICKWLFDNWTG